MDLILKISKVLFFCAATALLIVGCFWAWHVGHQAQCTVASIGTAASGVSAAAIEAKKMIATAREAVDSAAETLAQVQRTAAAVPKESAAWRGALEKESEAWRSSTAAAMRDLDLVLSDADLTLKNARPQILGLLGGWKMTGGQAATLVRSVNQTAPAVLEDVKVTTGEVRKAAPAARAAVEDGAAVAHTARHPLAALWGKIKSMFRRIF